MEFSIGLIKFEAWQETISIQVLQKTIEQCVIHFSSPKMHCVSRISESIRRMGSSSNFTIHISKRQHITNVKKVHRSKNKVNYIRQILKHNDRCTSLNYMEETISNLALEGGYHIAR
jgi:hypothetical protein